MSLSEKAQVTTSGSSAGRVSPGRHGRVKGGKRLASRTYAQKKEQARQERTERRRRAVYVPTKLRRRKLTGKELLVLLIPAAAVVAAVLVVMLTVNAGTTYQFGVPGNQYYAGNPGWVAVGSELRREEGRTLLVTPEGTEQETVLPVYLEESRKIVLPADMLYFMPRTGQHDRVAALSEVECKTNGMITVRHGDSSGQTDPGFLYDGEDFYLFLEPMVLEFNGYRIDVPALSYVEAIYRGHIMVFNYDTGKFFMEASDGTGVARAPSGDYEISLLGDSMTLKDGSNQLLATRPELFDPVV